MSAMAAASSLSKIDSTSGILRCRTSSSVLWSGGGGGECGGVGVHSSSGRWPGCCEGGGGGGGLCAGVSVGVADILLAALKRPSALIHLFKLMILQPNKMSCKNNFLIAPHLHTRKLRVMNLRCDVFVLYS